MTNSAFEGLVYLPAAPEQVSERRFSGRLGDQWFGGAVAAYDAPPSISTVRERVESICRMAFGADASIGLVHGASGGIQAMLAGVLDETRSIVLPRNVHRSVLAGLVLSGARPIFVPPVVHQESGVLLPPSTESIQQALDVTPGADLLLTHPTYDGLCIDLEPLAMHVSQRIDCLLLIDGAHGAHLGLTPALPQSALVAGADIVVHSVQKTLSALTQTALMHVSYRNPRARGAELAARRLSAAPFAPFLHSLGAAARQFHEEGPALVEAALQTGRELRDAIRAIPGVRVLRDILDVPGVVVDPMKVVVVFDDPAIDAHTMAVALETEDGVGVELAGDRHLLAMLGSGSRPEDGRRLATALRKRMAAGPASLPHAPPLPWPDYPPLIVTPREALLCPSRALPPAEAVGAVSAQSIVPYPPGIPLIQPGEVVTPEVVDYIEARTAAERERALPPLCGFDGMIRVLAG